MDFHFVVHKDLQVDPEKGLHQHYLQFNGCPTCAAKALAEYIIKDEKIRQIVFTAVTFAGTAMAFKAQNPDQL